MEKKIVINVKIKTNYDISFLEFVKIYHQDLLEIESKLNEKSKLRYHFDIEEKNYNGELHDE